MPGSRGPVIPEGTDLMSILSYPVEIRLPQQIEAAMVAYMDAIRGEWLAERPARRSGVADQNPSQVTR